MKKLNILVTALGGDIGGNIVNILQEQKSVQFNITGTDINDKIFHRDLVDRFYKVARTDDPAYKEQIVDIIKKEGIEIVIPVSEIEILWFNDNRNLFNELNVKVLINSKKIIESFLNKEATSNLLKEIGVSTPRTLLFSEFDSQLPFPLIVKSRYSVNSKEVYTVKNARQLDYLKLAIENPDDFIVQDCIGSIDEEYTTAVYSSGDKTEVITFRRKLNCDKTFFATIKDEKILNDYAGKIAESFELQGSINIQSRKQGDDFYIFEINPRFSSTVYIREHFGFQDLLWWIEDALNSNTFSTENKQISHSGSAVLGFQYRFF